MRAIQWPRITISGEEFELAFTWSAIRRLMEAGVDFFDPAAGQELSPDEGQVLAAKLIAAAISTAEKFYTWQWVMDNALPHEVVGMMSAIQEAREKVSALVPAARPAAENGAATSQS